MRWRGTFTAFSVVWQVYSILTITVLCNKLKASTRVCVSHRTGLPCHYIITFCCDSQGETIPFCVVWNNAQNGGVFYVYPV
nr:MAG TPA: hypothetical protein [Bacteriophage sp.]